MLAGSHRASTSRKTPHPGIDFSLKTKNLGRQDHFQAWFRFGFLLKLSYLYRDKRIMNLFPPVLLEKPEGLR
jgi:hypothetical protein